MTTPPLLALYQRMQRWPAGSWLFTRAVCFKAPYFASIAPHITRLEAGRCEGTLKHRRKVSNHLGTVHAIAMCNLAELVAGLMTDVTLPGSMRWIPRGMDVQYLKKAKGNLHAVAIPLSEAVAADRAYELAVEVNVLDAQQQPVMRAHIRMWVSPRAPLNP